MKLSAFIVSFNKRDDMKELLNSIKQQIRQPDELFVVDNLSTDGTHELVQNDCHLPLITPTEPIGACESFNVGFKKARYELIGFFDDDVLLRKDWFKRMVRAIKKESEQVAVFSSNIIYSLPFPEVVKDYPRFLDSFEGCASIIRKSALEKVGYYDERFFIYGNERDLACRLLAKGYKIRFVPDALALHKRGPQVRLGHRSMYYHTRNMLWNYLKHLPLKKLWKAMLKSILKTFLRAYKNGLLPSYFKALFGAVMGLGYCIRNRVVYDYLV